MGRGRNPKVDDKTILRFFVVGSDPIYTAAEVSEKFDEISKETARNRLENLVDKGYLERKKPSSRVVIYWITREGMQHYEAQAD